MDSNQSGAVGGIIWGPFPESQIQSLIQILTKYRKRNVENLEWVSLQHQVGGWSRAGPWRKSRHKARSGWRSSITSAACLYWTLFKKDPADKIKLKKLYRVCCRQNIPIISIDLTPFFLFLTIYPQMNEWSPYVDRECDVYVRFRSNRFINNWIPFSRHTKHTPLTWD